MMKIHFLLLLCSSLAWARPEPELKIEVEELKTVVDPEETEGYFEGDIVLSRGRNAIKDADSKWPGGILYYEISKVFRYPPEALYHEYQTRSIFPPNELVFAFTQRAPQPKHVKVIIIAQDPYFVKANTTRATILEAMREMESNTKHGSKYCVRFVERTPKHRDYVTFYRGKGCNSAVGRQGGRQLLSLGVGCEQKGTIMHELTHALGFWHEQSRYDRDTYLSVHTDNINKTKRHNFNKGYSSQMTLLRTPYDFGSLMHYGPYAFALDKSKPTISPKPGKASGVTMGQRLAMSTQDVTRIQKLYQCTVDTSHITRPPTSANVVDCDFDNDLCKLIQDTKDDFDWTRKSGSTPTSRTGPNADHTNGAGYYLYAEANGHHNKSARLLTKTLTKGYYCSDFWLFQYGSQVGSFRIRIAGPRIREQAVSIVAGSRSNYWQHYRMNLKIPASFHFIFQATIGSGDLGDIAIDDFVVYKGRCL